MVDNKGGEKKMDPIFNLFKIKFTILDTLISENCKDITPKSKVNVFINLEDVIKKLANSNIEDYLRIKDNERNIEFISNVLNLASHYRLFFSKNRLYSKIFLYINYPFGVIYKNRLINLDFRTYYENKYSKNPNHFVLNDVLNNSLPLAKIITEYVEGVYLIFSDYIESSLTPYIITKDSNSNTVNFILTEDIYDYQYVNHNFYLLQAKKEESILVTKDNVFNILKAKMDVNNDKSLDSRYIPFILALLGNKKRNIQKIKGIGLSTIIKMVNKALDEQIISKDAFNINILANMLKPEFRKQLLDNFYCTDIETQYSMLNIKDTYTITSQVIDKFDNVTLKKINNEHFQLHPIQLMELTSGSRFLTKENNKKNIFKI